MAALFYETVTRAGKGLMSVEAPCVKSELSFDGHILAPPAVSEPATINCRHFADLLGGMGRDETAPQIQIALAGVY